MASGEWAGTMNLTEPHCGTDLGLLRTKAARQWRRVLFDHGPENLDFRRRAGPHHNIIHLVLARIEGAPEGVKGISLFVVPKFIVMRMAAWANAMPSHAAGWKRRWAFTATPPA